MAYFAASLIRRQQNATGFGLSVGDPIPIILCFAPPVPGANQDRRVYYRTIPERYQNTHRPPWIGRGYVKIRGNEAQPAVAGWTGDGLRFVQNTMYLSAGEVEASISADYAVIE